MVVNDPIGDMLTRIRNALMRYRESVEMPHSKMLENIAKVLKREGFIKDYSVEENKPRNILRIDLAYENGESVIRGLKRVSKPGVRLYTSYKSIKPVKNSFGIAIISTSKGLMTDEEARKNKIGGEILCEIW